MNAPQTPDSIELLPTADLVPYARNSRTHSAEQVQQIAASIREFGFTNPVLIDQDNGIIAGHGRVMAAQSLDMDQVPCIRLGHLTEAQRRAYVIADNKLGLNAGWDEEVLALELQGLAGLEFDLGLTGFDDEEINGLLALLDVSNSDESDADAVPVAPVQPVTQLGDVWLLGGHRVMCGDSNDAGAISRLVGADDVDVFIFDPPYELETLYETAMPAPATGKKLIVFWDFKRFARASCAAVAAGWQPQYELIWDNVTSWYTQNRPLARHKACGVFGDDPKWNFDAAIIRDGKIRTPRTVFNNRGKCVYTPLDGAVHLRTVEAFPTTAESSVHAHSKPVAWIEAIFNGCGGDVYLDLFGGSGSTLVACENTGRRSRIMELEPRYTDVIVRRWQDVTGQQATHAETGKTFAAMAKERGVPA